MNAEPYGSAHGRAVERYTLARGAGITLGVLTYGGIIDSLEVPDAAGTPANVVLGYADLDGYVHAPNTYFGSIIGRFGNRIAGGRFELDGHTHTLAVNNGPNALHGGLTGFDKVVWDVEAATSTSLALRHVSPAGDEGYPGTLDARVTYELDAENRLSITYAATTDAPTIVNLTNHSYFNLGGEGSGDVFGHLLAIDAQRYTPVNEAMIPTGEVVGVAGTPFDFRTARAIGEHVRDGDPQLLRAQGYDHNFVLDNAGGHLARAAFAFDPRSGRSLEIRTTEPGIQFYSGNFLDATQVGRGGSIYRQSAGFALETQHFPDSPNQPNFPTTVLRPGETYRSQTVWQFAAQPVG